MAHSIKFFVLVIITVITVVTGCASSPSAELVEKYGPPVQLIKKHDHTALAKWYEQEAAALRQRTEDMRAMVGEVRDYDAKGFYQDKLTIMMHGKDLADGYSDAADKADKLAQIHRSRQSAQ